MRASGQAPRSPDMGAYGGLGGRCKTQLRLNAPIIFFGSKLGLYQQSLTARSILEHVSICSPSWETIDYFFRAEARWKRIDFCTTDRLGITHGRKTVSPSRNPCHSDPLWSQPTIDVRLHKNQFLYARSRMKRYLRC